MYATVRQLKIKESFKEENQRRVRDELLPELRTIPGFVDYYLIYTDKETELSIGLFKDKKGADAMNRIAGEFVKPLAPKAQLEEIIEGTVTVQAGALSSV